MAGVNLAEDGQSMTREFLNGRLCKRGNNLQPRSKGARVADVTGFLRDFVHRDVYSISNPITEENHVYYRRARFNWKLFIHREDGIEIKLSRRGEIQSVKVTNSFPRKRILIFGKARSRSHRSCHRARSSSARSIDTTRRPTPSKNDQNGSVVVAHAAVVRNAARLSSNRADSSKSSTTGRE